MAATGAEEIHGRGSNDVVNAGMGGDVLVCQSGDGHDTTGDFNHHGDPDHLRHGGNTVITFPEGGSITLVNVKAGTLDATDFSFHQKLAVDGI